MRGSQYTLTTALAVKVYPYDPLSPVLSVSGFYVFGTTSSSTYLQFDEFSSTVKTEKQGRFLIAKAFA